MFKKIAKKFIDRAVYASVGYEELKNALIANSSSLIDFSKSPKTEFDNRILAIAKLVKPSKLKDMKEIRVGCDHDGGYVMYEISTSKIDGAMSIGVGPDVSWDLDVAAMGIKVDMFDPTIRKIPAKVSNGTFHKIGIGTVDSIDSKYVPIMKLREIAGLENSTEIILKIDVEGAEWTSLRNLPKDELSRYSQIAIEMHNLSRISDDEYFSSVVDVLQSLSASHVPVHLHANNYAPLNCYGNYWFPDAIEVTYVRRDSLLQFTDRTSVASPLDEPNCPTMIDFNLDGVLHA